MIYYNEKTEFDILRLSLPEKPKTAVIFGSPRKGGHTKKCLDGFLPLLPGGGKAEIISAYDLNPAPCRACMDCVKSGACADPGLGAVFEKLIGADLAVIASPVYFLGFPAPLKAIIDRMQPYYIGKSIKKAPGNGGKPGAGVLIATSGRDDAKTFEFLKRQAGIIFPLISKELRGAYYFPGTDDINEELRINNSTFAP